MTTTTTTNPGDVLAVAPGRRVMSNGNEYGPAPLLGWVWLAGADATVWPPTPAGWLFETVQGYRSPFRRDTEQAAVTALLALEVADAS